MNKKKCHRVLHRPCFVLFLLAFLTFNSCVKKYRSHHPPVVETVQDLSIIPPAPFHRGMWVRAVSVASADSIPKILAIARQLDITDIYVQTVVAGYAYYQSEILPRSQYLAELSVPSYDPLDSLIKAAYRDSIRVHAWVNALLVWSLKDPPDSLHHIYFEHPDWFIVDANGKSMHEYTYTEWLQAGLEGLYLDPANVAVQNHIAQVCAEIAGKYPVSGIHLDFIRYPGTLWGLPQNDTSYAFAGKEGYCARWLSLLRYPQLSFNLRWLTWHNWKQYIRKSHKIAEIMWKTAENCKRVSMHSDCILTAAVFANPNLALYRFGQDWTSWDMLEYPLVMSYCEDLQSFLNIVTYTKNTDPDAIYGIGLLWENIDTVAYMQSQSIKTLRTKGLCYFDFTNLDTLVDLSVIQGRNMTFHIAMPDGNFPDELITGVFYNRPLQILTEGEYTSFRADSQFVRFLLSLSLNSEHDLRRLGLTIKEFMSIVLDDIKAFRNLDKYIFPLPDKLLKPPFKTVEYQFYPWDEEDTLVILQKAQKANTYSQRVIVAPSAMNPIARAAFDMKVDQKKIIKTRAGVYALQVTEETKPGKKVARQDIIPNELPLYASWTITQRVEQILGEKNGKH